MCTFPVGSSLHERREGMLLSMTGVEVVSAVAGMILLQACENDIRILAIVSHFFIFVLYFSTAKKVV